MIPKEGDSAEKFLTYISADARTTYEGENNIDYQRRLDYVNDLEPSQLGDSILTRGMTRAADEEILRWNPFDAQTLIELGGVINTTGWVDDLLTAAEMATIYDVQGKERQIAAHRPCRTERCQPGSHAVDTNEL